LSKYDNKAVVRQFITEVLTGQKIALVDKLAAPNYVNRGMGDADLAGFKAMFSGMKSAKAGMDIVIENLIAEGDSVVFRGIINVTLPNGDKVTARGITYYRLANGKIIEDDPITTPDLMQTLGNLMPPRSDP
jgi:predicted SnoaL-like aldol condensation-catalyzing enzyme